MFTKIIMFSNKRIHPCEKVNLKHPLKRKSFTFAYYLFFLDEGHWPSSIFTLRMWKYPKCSWHLCLSTEYLLRAANEIFAQHDKQYRLQTRLQTRFTSGPLRILKWTKISLVAHELRLTYLNRKRHLQPFPIKFI